MATYRVSFLFIEGVSDFPQPLGLMLGEGYQPVPTCLRQLVLTLEAVCQPNMISESVMKP